MELARRTGALDTAGPDVAHCAQICGRLHIDDLFGDQLAAQEPRLCDLQHVVQRNQCATERYQQPAIWHFFELQAPERTVVAQRGGARIGYVGEPAEPPGRLTGARSMPGWANTRLYRIRSSVVLRP